MQSAAVRIAVFFVFCFLPWNAIAGGGPEGSPAEAAGSDDETLRQQQNRQRFQQLLQIRYGYSIQKVLDTLGEPEERNVPLNSIGRTRRLLDFVYHQLAVVEFKKYKAEKPLRARVGHVDYQVLLNYERGGRIEFLRVVLATDNTVALSTIAEYLHQKRDYSAEEYDRFAERLEKDYLTTDDALVNALSYFCLILAREPGAVHAELLGRISEHAASSKLRRHAKTALDRVS